MLHSIVLTHPTDTECYTVIVLTPNATQYSPDTQCYLQAIIRSPAMAWLQLHPLHSQHNASVANSSDIKPSARPIDISAWVVIHQPAIQHTIYIYIYILTYPILTYVLYNINISIHLMTHTFNQRHIGVGDTHTHTHTHTHRERERRERRKVTD